MATKNAVDLEDIKDLLEQALSKSEQVKRSRLKEHLTRKIKAALYGLAKLGGK